MGIILGAITAIATAAATVTKALTVTGLVVQGLKAVGSALVSLGKALGLIKPETKVEELGDKAIQSEYKPEDYDTYAEYVKAVEDYDLDPEKSKLSTEEEKVLKGAELASGSMIEKFKEFPMQEFCIAAGKNPDFFTETKMSEIGKLIQNDGQNIANILNYVNGSEKDSGKLQSTIDMLVDVEKKTDPSLSDKDAYRHVLEARN